MSYRIGLAVVGTFQSTADAETAKSVLAAVGVDCLIRSDNAPGISQSLSQTELLVRNDDAEKAKYALAHATPASG